MDSRHFKTKHLWMIAVICCHAAFLYAGDNPATWQKIHDQLANEVKSMGLYPLRPEQPFSGRLQGSFYYKSKDRKLSVSLPTWRQAENKDPKEKRHRVVSAGSRSSDFQPIIIQFSSSDLTGTPTTLDSRSTELGNRYRKSYRTTTSSYSSISGQFLTEIKVKRSYQIDIKDKHYAGLPGKTVIVSEIGKVPKLVGYFKQFDAYSGTFKASSVSDPKPIEINSAFEMNLDSGKRFLFTIRLNGTDHNLSAFPFPTEGEIDAYLTAAARILKEHFSRPPEPPILEELSAEQRHISYNEAHVKLSARAVYNNLGEYSPSDIQFSAFLDGYSQKPKQPAQSLKGYSESFDMRSDKIKVEGNTLTFDHIIKVNTPGNYTLRITIKDERFRSGASSRTTFIAYQDTLSCKFRVSRPAAVIVGVNEMFHLLFSATSGRSAINLHRIEPSTATGGITVNRKGPAKKGTSQVNILKDLFPQFWQDSWRQTRGKDNYLEANSPYVYNGDRIQLAGESLTTVRILWENGAMGMAMFKAKHVNSGEFTIGHTRGASGKWSKTWSELWQRLGKEGKVLFEQTKKDKQREGVEWLIQSGLKIDPDSIEGTIYGDTKAVLSGNIPDSVQNRIQPSSTMAQTKLSLFFSLFSAFAGDTVISDITFVELNSLVYIRPQTDNTFEIYTLEGNPEIISGGGASTQAVPAGNMVSIDPGQKPQTRQFQPKELDRWWEQARRRTAGGYDIPFLKANVTALKFYEDGPGTLAKEKRVYKKQFSKQESRYINWEINLQTHPPGQRIDYEIDYKYYKPDGSIDVQDSIRTHIESDWTSPWTGSGCGWDEPGKWEPGKYRVDLFIRDQKIASDFFEITEGKGTSTKQYDIPFLKANVTALKFYEKGPGTLARDKRVYKKRFSKQDSRYIHWELNLETHPPGQRIDYEIDYKYYKPDGSIDFQESLQTYIESDWTRSWPGSGCGWDEPGKWEPGEYRVDLFIKGNEIASDYFEVY